MRHFRIFLLNFQKVFEQRSRSFVWFLMSLINPMLFLLMWTGASFKNPQLNTIWPQTARNTYYFLLIIASSTLMSHIEEDISDRDIKHGKLVGYLLKPYSYFWHKFFSEIPYRLLQGMFGILVFIAVSLLGIRFSVTHELSTALLSLLIIILALLIGFTYKMILGLWAFWLLDIWGVYQVTEVLLLMCAGFILPLDLYPHWLQNLTLFTPYPYMIYFPILSLQDRFTHNELLFIISKQLIWLALLKLAYSFLWSKGIRKFTGVGQ